jgi:hypothetical protein
MASSIWRAEFGSIPGPAGSAPAPTDDSPLDEAPIGGVIGIIGDGAGVMATAAGADVAGGALESD